MEEIAGSFFDNYEEGFLEYLEVHKAQALKDREDYQTLNKKISELKYKYQNVRTFLEEKDNVKSYQYKAAIYIRLSVEDGDKEESNSITNQRMLLNQFLKDNSDIEVYDYYTDDGFSGTTFNRPGF